MATPDELIEYFTVRYQAIGTTDDGVDVDDLPDKTEISGWVTFTANLRKGRGIKFIDSTPPFELFPLKRRVRVVNGQLNHNDTGYVKLEAASLNGNPSDWNWEVSFDLATPTGKIAADPFSIPAVPGSSINLVTVSPVGASSGTQIVQGPRGISLAEITLVNGDTFEFYGNDVDHTLISSVTIPALLFAPQAEAARDAAQDYSVIASTAASLAVTNAEASNLSQIAAAGSAGAADASADAAATSESNASASAAAAAGSATSAGTSATNAATSKTGADTAKTAAETARDAAAGSATAAAGSATSANTAKTGAETARTGAETARTGAETAQTAAEAARDAALAGVVPDDGVSTIKIQNGAVTKVKTDVGVQASLDKADNSVQKTGSETVAGVKTFSSIPELPASDPTTGNQATRKSYVDGKYTKPGTGIPKSDLTAALQGSIDKADASAPIASPTFTGTLVTPALRVNGGSPGAGKLLTSDALGNATWQPAGGTQPYSEAYITGSTTVSASNSVAQQTGLNAVTTDAAHTFATDGITVPAGTYRITCEVNWNATATNDRGMGFYDGTWYRMHEGMTNNNANTLQQFVYFITVTASTKLFPAFVVGTTTTAARTLASGNLTRFMIQKI